MIPLLASLWALPCTMLGTMLAVFGGANFRFAPEARTMEFTAPTRGPWVWFFERSDFRAITIGEVIVWRDLHAMHDRHLAAHELRHVAQYRRLGPLFFIAYPLLSLLALVMGREAHGGNWLEMEAKLAANEGDHAR